MISLADLKMIPVGRRYFYCGMALVVIGYLAWSRWGYKQQQPSAGFVTAKPAVSTSKVDGPLLKAPLKIVPKPAVKKKFPTAHVDDPDEEVIDTADIDPTPNGATAITTINTQTGEARTEVKVKEAPWFALQRQNYLGAGYELHMNGDQKLKFYYKRDLARSKDVYLQGELQGKIPINGSRGEVEGYVGGNLEYRFVGW